MSFQLIFQLLHPAKQRLQARTLTSFGSPGGVPQHMDWEAEGGHVLWPQGMWGNMLLPCSESTPTWCCAHQVATICPGKRLANSHTDRMKNPAWASHVGSQHFNHGMLGEHTKFNNWTHLTEHPTLEKYKKWKYMIQFKLQDNFALSHWLRALKSGILEDY